MRHGLFAIYFVSGTLISDNNIKWYMVLVANHPGRKYLIPILCFVKIDLMFMVWFLLIVF